MATSALLEASLESTPRSGYGSETQEKAVHPERADHRPAGPAFSGYGRPARRARVYIAERLLQMGARVKAYDPVAAQACRAQHPNCDRYCASARNWPTMRMPGGGDRVERIPRAGSGGPGQTDGFAHPGDGRNLYSQDAATPRASTTSESAAARGAHSRHHRGRSAESPLRTVRALSAPQTFDGNVGQTPSSVNPSGSVVSERLRRRSGFSLTDAKPYGSGPSSGLAKKSPLARR